MHSCTSHIRTGPDVIAHRHHSREQSEQQKKRKKGSEKKTHIGRKEKGRAEPSEGVRRLREEKKKKKRKKIIGL